MDSNFNSDYVPIRSISKDDRISRLYTLFEEKFHSKPLFIVRVPGRVNLIGEHIDYCGYPVLPMALEQDILIATGLFKNPVVQIHNINEKYINYDFNLNSCEDMKQDDKGKPFWYNYVICGIKGAMEYMEDKFDHGLQLCIDGNIPPASGLSSSSALVSAACLSFLHAHGIEITKSDIASLCARSERYIGTQGGGMDQAIAFLAEKYCAQYITWQPLKATPVSLPEDATFVVAHSLAEANKAATNDFNTRVMECRLAARVLATVTGVNTDKKIINLGQVHSALGYSLDEMVQLVLKHLPQNIYTKNEICTILQIGQEELESVYSTPNTNHISEFKLKQRALHVYEEAIRVDKFRDVCNNAIISKNSTLNGVNGSNGSGDGTNNLYTLEVLGKLMSESHESLKNLYECSHPNLNSLVEISQGINIHSRLTGAGWGGCIVALCPKNQVDHYIKTLQEQFYAKLYDVDKSSCNKYVFATTPNYGAVIHTAD